MSGRQKILPWLGLLGRLAAGGVLVYAGYLKAAAPVEEFAYAIEGYKIFPPALALAAAYVMPWIELMLGACLLARFYTRAAALCSGALFLVFEALLLSAIIRKLPLTDCGCFGSAGNSSPAREFCLNLVLLFAVFLALKYGELSIPCVSRTLLTRKDPSPK